MTAKNSATIDIAIVSGSWPKINPLIKKAALKTLSDSGYLKKHKNTELGITLAGDAFVKKLNKRYRGKNKPTNVLSFPQDEPGMLGDVVLAYETVAQEAKAQGKTFKNHCIHLVIHGILHLLGHDHESVKEAQKMEALEIRILKSFGVKNPYEL